MSLFYQLRNNFSKLQDLTKKLNIGKKDKKIHTLDTTDKSPNC